MTLQSKVIELLKDNPWIEDLPEENVQISFWNPSIQLTNIIAKHRKVIISPGISLSVEDGVIRKVNMSCPLLSGFGKVEIMAESIDFVVQLDFSVLESTPVSPVPPSYDHNKMIKILEDELLVLGSTKNTPWYRILLDTIIGKAFSAIISQVSFSLKRINFVVLIPDDNSTFFAAKFFIESISFDTPLSSSAAKHEGESYNKSHIPVISKEISIRNLRVYCRRCESASSFKSRDAFIENLLGCQEGLMISPLQLSLSTEILQTSFNMPFSISNTSIVVAELYLSTLDINCSLGEIKLLIETFDHIQFHLSKIRLAPLRKSIFGNTTKENKRDYNRLLWQFAMKGVVDTLQLGEKRIHDRNLATALLTLKPKLKYSDLLSKGLRSAMSVSIQNYQVMGIASELSRLECTLAMEDIFLIRNFVIDRLLSHEGYCPAEISRAITKIYSTKCADFLIKYKLPDLNPESEYATSLEELHNSRTTMPWSIKVFVTAEKASVCFFKEEVRPMSTEDTKQNRMKRNPKFHPHEDKFKQKSNIVEVISTPIKYEKTCSFIVNCVNTVVESADKGDMTYSIMMGSFQLFGQDNINLICMGRASQFEEKWSFRSNYDLFDPDYCISANLRILNHFIDTHSQFSGKKIAKVFVSDIGGRVSHALFKPSPRRMFMELRVQDTTILWDGDSVKALLQIFSNFHGLPKLTVNKTDLNSSANLSELTCKFFNGGNCVVEEKFRMSIEVIVSNIRLLFELGSNPPKLFRGHIQEPTNLLEVVFQKFYFCTGDYLENSLPREKNDGDPSIYSMNEENEESDDDDSTDFIIAAYDPLRQAAKVVRKVRNALVRPRLLMVEGACIQYTSTKVQILSPWNVCSIWIPSFSKAYEDFTDNRFDIYCADLKMLVDTKDIVNILKVIEVSRKYSGDKKTREHDKHHKIIPRFKEFSGLSVLFLKVKLHHLDLALVDDKTDENIIPGFSLLSSILQRYGQGISSDLHDPVINTVHRDMAMKRFRNAGISNEQTVEVLSCFRQKLKSIESINPSSMLTIVNHALKDVDPNFLTPKHQNILLKLVINRVAVKFHQLTYDCRLLFALNALTIYDNSRISLFSIHRNPSKFEDMNFFSSVDPLRRGSSERCGFWLEMVMKDHRYPFGIGGVARNTIVNISDPTQWQENAFSVAVNIQNVSVEFDSFSIAKIFTEVESIRTKVSNRNVPLVIEKNSNKQLRVTHYEEGEDRRLSLSHAYSPAVDAKSTYKWHFYIALHLEELTCALSNNDKSFAILCLQRAQNHTQVDYLNSLMADIIIDSISVIDLTCMGKLRRHIIWKAETTQAEETPMLFCSISASESGDRDIIISTNFLRVNAICRFIYEMIDYIQHCVIHQIVEGQNSTSDTPHLDRSNESDSDEEDVKFRMHDQQFSKNNLTSDTSRTTLFFFSTDNQIHIPRNSMSNDVMCGVISNIEVSIGTTPSLLEAPSPNKVSGKGNGHLYFDVDYNVWCRADTLMDAMDEEDWEFFPCVGGDHVVDSSGGTRINIVASHIHVFTTVESLQKGSPCRTFQPNSCVFDDFENKEEEEYFHIDSICPSHGEVFQSAFVRNQSQEWEYLDLKQKWGKNTREHFNLQVVVDIGEKEIKVLLADTKDFSRLSVVASHCEYHIFLGLWFDNVQESPQYLEEAMQSPVDSYMDSEVHLATERLRTYGSKTYLEYMLGRPCSFELLLVRAEVMLCCALDVNHYQMDIPMFYRTNDMMQFDREKAFETQFGIKNSADDTKLKASALESNACKARRVIPFVDIRAAGIVLCVRNFEDVVRLFISGETLEAYDVSISKHKQLKPAIPLLLRVSTRITTEEDLFYNPSWPSIRNFTYGLPDMKFGFCQDAPTIQTMQDVPFKFSLLSSTPSNWMTLNIGIDHVDANIYKLDTALVGSDFFSIYFRYEEFGHPGVAAYYSFPESKFPYGGLDLRIFITRPHISFLYSDTRVSSPALILEAENGASFRYIYDSKGSTRYEVSCHDLVAVLVKQYRPPILYRGARGCSGSGRGVRTTIENLNADFVHHFDGLTGGIDVKLDVFSNRSAKSPDRQMVWSNDGCGIIDINSQWNGMHSIVLTQPTCLRPIKRTQNCLKANRTCDIVTCYEDILFCIKVVKTVFSLDDIFVFSGNSARSSEDSTMMLVWSVSDLRIMLVDNVLGMHLPLFQFLFEDVASCVARNDHLDENFGSTLTELRSNKNLQPFFYHFGFKNDNTNTVEDDKFFIAASVWGEYFNSLRKCWEPLCEKIKAEGFYEQSKLRGKGLSVRSENSIHLNFSGALVRALLDVLRTFEVKEVDLFHEHVSDIQRKLLDQRSHNGFDWIDEFQRKRPLGKESALSHTNSGEVEDKTHKGLVHLPSSIDPKLRVGFSILNLTGQPVRYLQHYGDGRNVIQYINDGERGLLNFVATQSLLKNNKPVEESFDVQQEAGGEIENTHQRKSSGNHVTLQVAGFQWLARVQVDELGAQCKALRPILGRMTPVQNLTEDMKKYLNLIVEVAPYCGGRMLTLRSVFSLRNNTNHSLKIKAKRFGDDNASDANSYFVLKAGNDLNLPLALLHKNFGISGGKSLGSLFVKPIDAMPIIEELGRNDNVESDYSTDPINLLQIATNKSALDITENLSDFPINENEEDSILYSRNGIITQLYCPVSYKKTTDQSKDRSPDHQYSIKNDPSHLTKLQPFCYCVEVISSNVASPNTAAEFNIVVHPPITVENLLSMGAFFELVHHENKDRILWSSYIEPGKMIPIHTVNLDEPLDLMITMRYCRSSEGVLVHEPLSRANRTKGFAKQLKRTLEGFLEEGEKEEISTIVLTDSVGQKLRLHVENNEGGGGQKNIVVYCPYWIVNSTQYVYRIREEGEIDLPAGTRVHESKDGTRPIPHNFFSNNFDPNPSSVLRSPVLAHNKPLTTPTPQRGLVKSFDKRPNTSISFPGLPGPFHNMEIPTDGLEWELLNDISFHKTVEHAYMFNFREESTLLSINKKVKIQLEDSDWSRSFSLDSVGVNQALAINHPESGILEVGFKISLAPGKLSKYTKIIRFLPRYTFVNRLPVGIRVIQADGFGEEGQESRRHEKFIAAHHAKTYHLPVLFGERKLLMKIDGPWQTTVPINIDYIGSFSLEVKKQFDLASIPHVNTRGAPEYSVELPPNITIGLGFETDWGEENIVVKSLQSGCFAARETDIKVGDVLIAVDEIPVSAKQFEHVMALLKSNLNQHSVTIKLRTIEEKLRIIREFAIAEKRNSERRRAGSVATPKVFSPLPSTLMSHDQYSIDGMASNEIFPVRVEFRPVDSSVMVVVSPLSAQENVEYRIENRSVSFCLHYKQKGIVGNSWATIMPGETKPYVWEDPFKPHKLLMHVGDNILSPADVRNGKALREGVDFGEKGKGDDSLSIYLTYLTGVASDSAVIINMDEIGSCDALPIGKEEKLSAMIKSEGPTKILSVVPNPDDKDYREELDFCYKFGRKQMESVHNILADILPNDLPHNVVSGLTEQNLSKLQEIQRNLVPGTKTIVCAEPIERIFEAAIDKLHQLYVEVFEAKELPQIVDGKMEDIYCKLYIRNAEKMNIVERSFTQAYYTYVCDQTFQPSWLKQRFVFDVPSDAAEEYRGYNLRILVKAKSLIGMDPVLAKLDVPFSCLKEEKPIEGWFPLRPSRATVLAANVSGSIRLKLHWIHSGSKLTNYFLGSMERRHKELESYLRNDQFSKTRLFCEEESSKQNECVAKVDDINLDFHDRLVVSDDINSLLGGQSPVRSSALSASIDLNDDGSVCSSKRNCENISPLPLHCFKQKYESWFRVSEKFTSLHNALSNTMDRNHAFQQCNQVFSDSFNRECLRNFVHVYTQKGKLKIIPAQITNLPEINHNLHIKVSYGKETFTTSSKPYGPSITWFNDNSDTDIDYQLNVSEITTETNPLTSDNPGLTVKDISFDIDMLNVRGTLRFRVMAETFPKYQEVARVEIPISSILDCCCILPQDGMYEAWFPLNRLTDRNGTASDISVQSFESRTEQFQFGDYDQSMMRIRLQWCADTVDDHALEASHKNMDYPIFYSRIQIPSFSVSLIDSDHARAVMLATIIGIELRRGVTKEHTDLSINITNLHVDNQLPDSYCPVIVAPTTVKFPQPVVRVHVRKNNTISKANLSCYKMIQMVVQELDVKLEQQTVLASWELVKTLLNQKRQSDSSIVLDTKLFDDLEMTNLLQDASLPSPFATIADTPKKSSSSLLKTFQSPQKGDIQAVRNLLEDANVLKLYIENFSISSIKINVSFFTTPQHIVEHYRKGATADLRNERALGIFSAISFFLWQVGEVVLDLTSSISDAPIYFNGFQAAYLFKTALDIQETLLEHYLHNALGQLYKIVGSLDLVGNPIGLLSSLGVGVHDFFYEPAHALINNPTEIGKIGKGVVKGTVSLVSNTTDGFLGTGTTITRSVGRGFAKLSMDSSFLKAREKLQKPPSTLTETMTRPMKDVGNGFYYGVVGLVKVPYNSVKRHGMVGFVPGVAKGVAGLAADPIVGILDAVTHSGDAFRGILKSTNKERETTAVRIRFSELFAVDGRLLPYNHNIAFGTQIIQFLSKTPIAASNRNNLRSSPESRHRSDSLVKMAAPTKRENSISSVTTPNSNRSSLRRNHDGTLTTAVLIGSPFPHLDGPFFKFSAAKAEGIEMECVIYTAVLQKGELVAILTTFRIVVVEIPKKQNKASFPKLKWEVELSNIDDCHLEQEPNRNYIWKVKHWKDDDIPSKHNQSTPASLSPEPVVPNRKRGGKKKSVVHSSGPFLEQNHEELIHKLTVSHQDPGSFDLLNFHDCVQTVRNLNRNNERRWRELVGHSAGMETAVREDEFGTRHIGPWQYVLRSEQEKLSSDIKEQGLMVGELECEEWRCKGSYDSNSKPKPGWLLLEENEALIAHSSVANLVALCNELKSPEYKRHLPLQTIIKQFEAGEISGEKFKEMVDNIRSTWKVNLAAVHDPSSVDKEGTFPSKKAGVFFETVGTVAKFATNVFKKSRASEQQRSKNSTSLTEDGSLDGKESTENSWTKRMYQVQRNILSAPSTAVTHNTSFIIPRDSSMVSTSSDEKCSTSNDSQQKNSIVKPEVGTIRDENEKFDDNQSVASHNSQLVDYYLSSSRLRGRKSLESATSQGDAMSQVSDIHPEGSLYEEAYGHNEEVTEEDNPLLSKESTSMSRAPSRISTEGPVTPLSNQRWEDLSAENAQLHQRIDRLENMLRQVMASSSPSIATTPVEQENF